MHGVELLPDLLEGGRHNLAADEFAVYELAFEAVLHKKGQREDRPGLRINFEGWLVRWFGETGLEFLKVPQSLVRDGVDHGLQSKWVLAALGSLRAGVCLGGELLCDPLELLVDLLSEMVRPLLGPVVDVQIVGLRDPVRKTVVRHNHLGGQRRLDW